jgi:hypothetical protein
MPHIKTRMNMIFHSKPSFPSSSTHNHLAPLESPFSQNSSFVLYLEPVYNSFLQVYQNIITLNVMPPGPLSHMVTYCHFPKLSTFQEPNATYDPFMNCVHVLLRFPVSQIGSGYGVFQNSSYLMGVDDIPSIFSYLQNQGYKIDSSLTNMLQDGRVIVGGVSDKRFSGNRKMIAMVSFLGQH